MGAYDKMDLAMQGLLYGFDNQVESFPCSEAVTPGWPLYQTPGTPTSVHATYQSGDVFVGIAIASQRSTKNSVGTYEQYDDVNVLTKGKVWVTVSGAVSTAPVAAYATSGKVFTVTASGNYNIGAMFRTNQSTSGGLAVLEVNGPKLVA